MKIRQENREDYAQVEAVVKEAFLSAEHSDGEEHVLLARLRQSQAFIPELSLLLELDSQVVGHILLTKLKVGQSGKALALAPLAILPDYQARGYGAALIARAKLLASDLGYQAILVLGDPGYYSRFGFKRASNYGIQAPFDLPDDYFMVCFLESNPEELTGLVSYADEFEL